ncbi:unnamed protein product, partial [Durusdinium trenchii]
MHAHSSSSRSSLARDAGILGRVPRGTAFWFTQRTAIEALWFLPHRVSSICSCGCSSCLLCGSLSIRRPAPPILACNAKTSALYSWRWISGDRCLAQHRGPPNWKADVSPWQSITPSPPWSVDWSRSWRCTWPCSVGRPFRNLMELNMDAHTHRAHLTSPVRRKVLDIVNTLHERDRRFGGLRHVTRPDGPSTRLRP